MNMTEAMIDIETFDTKRTAVVFAVSVVLWGVGEKTKSHTFIIPVQEQLREGRTLSQDTLAFWLDPKVSKFAHETLNAKSGSVVHELIEFCASVRGVDAVWAKGALDFNVLEDILEEYGIAAPWRYNQRRELRTLMFETDTWHDTPATHDPLDDCFAQLAILSKIRAKLRPSVLPEGQSLDALTAASVDTDEL